MISHCKLAFPWPKRISTQNPSNSSYPKLDSQPILHSYPKRISIQEFVSWRHMGQVRVSLPKRWEYFCQQTQQAHEWRQGITAIFTRSNGQNSSRFQLLLEFRLVFTDRDRFRFLQLLKLGVVGHLLSLTFEVLRFVLRAQPRSSATLRPPPENRCITCSLA